MKKYLSAISVFLLAATLFIGCTEIKTPEPDNINEVVITLERTRCFGVCPAYILTIYGDGRVIYDGKDFVRINGTKTTTISEEKIRRLVTEFRNIDYFSLNDSYVELNATDMPSAITSITINGQTKTIRHYHGDLSAPKKLTQLENKIDEIVNTDQWIK